MVPAASRITPFRIGAAQISDDTQLTLFTANALLSAATRKRLGAPGGTIQAAAAACYRDWLRTQWEAYPLKDQNTTAWLVHVPELFHRRAPGGTCLETIAQGAWGTIERPINQSKGCGGIMRVAPTGLFLRSPSRAGLLAVRLAGEKQEDTQAIRALGEGWVAEETLAIAIYCALKYETDFNRALIAAVNHDGDSDSTGAVTGNLLGARLGLSGIPANYLEYLELKPVILELADDLYQGVPPAYGEEFQPLIHVIGTPAPEPRSLTPEHALWDAKHTTAVYVPPQTI